MPHDEKNAVHFLHIGKTGGTAIKEAIAHAPSHKFNLIVHRHSFRLRDVPIGQKVFFFLRDPLRRFVSGFLSRQRRGQPRYDSHWTPSEAWAYERFSTADQLAAALSSDSIQQQQAAIKAMKGINHVNRPLWYWFHNRAYLMTRKEDVLFIGFQENLATDFRLVCQLLGLDQADLPRDSIRAHQNPTTTDRHLSSVAEENLRKWYAEDFRLIALARQWRQRFDADRAA